MTGTLQRKPPIVLIERPTKKKKMEMFFFSISAFHFGVRGAIDGVIYLNFIRIDIK